MLIPSRVKNGEIELERRHALGRRNSISNAAYTEGRRLEGVRVTLFCEKRRADQSNGVARIKTNCCPVGNGT